VVHHAEAMAQKAQAYIDPKKPGLEVSPYFDPFLPKSDFNVAYTDYIDTDAIRAKAADNPGMQGQEVPAVDFVWHPGKSLAECAPANTRFSYAFASHVMEHVPNPAGWVNELLSTLKVGGYVVLFLPDRRHTSDYFRHETEFYQAAQWWIDQPPVPTSGQVLDFMSNAFSMVHGVGVAWSADGVPLDTERPYSDKSAVEEASFVQAYDYYMDIHCSVWTSDSFRRVFERLIAVGILNAEIVEVVEGGGEFLAVLKKLGEPKLSPPPKKTASSGAASSGELQRFRVIDHQLTVLRHDVAYLIEQGDRRHKRSLILRFKIWLKPKLMALIGRSSAK
jgi:SAM-dependent methyltransferase